MTNRYTANEVIDLIKDEAAEELTNEQIIAVLEDGEALAALGLTDDDQEVIEEAHAFMTARNFLYVIQVSKSANGATLKLMSKTAFCSRFGIKQDYDNWRANGGEVECVFESEDAESAEDTLKALYLEDFIDMETYEELIATLRIL